MRKQIIGIFVALVSLASSSLPFYTTLFQPSPASAQAAGPLDHVVISLSSVTLPVAGTQQFTAQGQDANNVAIPNLAYSWAVVAGGGAISSTGLFTAGNTPGTFANTVQVTAVQGSIVKTAYASVTLTAALGPLDHVVISLSSVTLPVAGTQQFTAQGQDANNVAIPNLTYSWAVVAGGGAISSTGLFTAGNTPGIFTNTVQVTAVQGSIVKTAYASVTLTAALAQPRVPSGWSKGMKMGWQGDTPPGWLKGNKNGLAGQ